MNGKIVKAICIVILLFQPAVTIYATNNANGNNTGNDLFINGDKNQTISNDVTLSDEQLIILFNIDSNYQDLYNGKITVEHNIDYGVTGKYQVKFIVTYDEVLCFDDKEDSGKGTEKTNDNKSKNQDPVTDEGVTCQNNADDNDPNDNDNYKYIEKQKVLVSFLTIDKEASIDPLISSDEYQSDYEHTVYTNEALIDLYNVTTNVESNQDNVVVSHNIDFSTPGQYEIEFTLTEGDKVVSTKATYEVLDLLPTLTSLDQLTINLGDELNVINDYQVVASELEVGDLLDKVTIHDSEVNYDAAGTYEFSISVTDNEGNYVVKNIILNIVDNKNEEQKLNAKELVTRPEGVTYSDEQLIEMFGLSANYELDLTSIKVEHNIDFMLAKKYPIIFTDESSGLKVESTFEVSDVLPTINTIDLIESPLNVVLSKEDYINLYSIQVAEITSNDIIDSLVIDDSRVNFKAVGNYEIYVSAVDNEGNEISKIVVLKILGDEEKPNSTDETDLIDETDSKKVIGEIGKPITDTELKHMYNKGNDVKVVSNINPEKVGTYEVMFINNDKIQKEQYQVVNKKEINTKRELSNYLKQNKIVVDNQDNILEGTYNVQIKKQNQEEPNTEIVEYKLKDTGVNTRTLVLIGGLGIGLVGLVVLKTKKNKVK